MDNAPQNPDIHSVNDFIVGHRHLLGQVRIVNENVLTANRLILDSADISNSLRVVALDKEKSSGVTYVFDVQTWEKLPLTTRKLEALIREHKFDKAAGGLYNLAEFATRIPKDVGIEFALRRFNKLRCQPPVDDVYVTRLAAVESETRKARAGLIEESETGVSAKMKQYACVVGQCRLYVPYGDGESIAVEAKTIRDNPNTASGVMVTAIDLDGGRYGIDADRWLTLPSSNMAVERTIEDAPVAHEGYRHTALCEFAHALPDGLDNTEILNLLKRFNERRCSPPQTMSEVKAVVYTEIDRRKAAKKEPRDVTPEQEVADIDRVDTSAQDVLDRQEDQRVMVELATKNESATAKASSAWTTHSVGGEMGKTVSQAIRDYRRNTERMESFEEMRERDRKNAEERNAKRQKAIPGEVRLWCGEEWIAEAYHPQTDAVEARKVGGEGRSYGFLYDTWKALPIALTVDVDDESLPLHVRFPRGEKRRGENGTWTITGYSSTKQHPIECVTHGAVGVFSVDYWKKMEKVS